MGKLRQNRFVSWSFAIVLALVIFFLVGKPVLLSYASSQLEEEQILQTANIEVSDGYQKIYFIDQNNKKTIITDNGQNSMQVARAGEYLVFVTQFEGAGQIFRYHVLSKTKLQLTESSTNQKPVVNEFGQVAWERWNTDHWELMFFDGVQTVRISEETKIAINPQLNESFLVFAEREGDLWKTVAYSLDIRQRSDVILGDVAKKPLLGDDSVIVSGIDKEKPKEVLSMSLSFLFGIEDKALQQKTPREVVVAEIRERMRKVLEEGKNPDTEVAGASDTTVSSESVESGATLPEEHESLSQEQDTDK